MNGIKDLNCRTTARCLAAAYSGEREGLVFPFPLDVSNGFSVIRNYRVFHDSFLMNGG